MYKKNLFNKALDAVLNNKYLIISNLGGNAKLRDAVNVDCVQLQDRICPINTTFSDNAVVCYINYLAFTALGKVNGDAQLSAEFARIDLEHMADKFKFTSATLNQQYQDFVAAYTTFAVNPTQETLDSLQTSFEEATRCRLSKRNTFMYDFLRNVKSISDAVTEPGSYTRAFTQRFLRYFNREVYFNFRELKVDETAALTTEVVLQAAYPQLDAQLLAQTSEWIAKEYRMRPEEFITRVARKLRYCLNGNWLSSFERFMEQSRQAASNPDDLNGLFRQLMERLDNIYKYEELRFMGNYEQQVPSLLTVADRDLLTAKQCLWFAIYNLEDFNTSTARLRLYVDYLDGKLTLAEFMACLHAVWVASLRLSLVGARQSSISLRRKLDSISMELQGQELVAAVREVCAEFASQVTSSEAVDTIRPCPPYRLFGLIITIGTQRFVNHRFIRSLILTNDPATPRDNKELGHFVATKKWISQDVSATEYLDCLYDAALEDQFLPARGTPITAEVIRTRTQQLLAQLWSVLDLDLTPYN